VLNLLANSFKFTHKGKIEVILDKTDDNQAQLTVIDTGIGIPKEEIPNIFTRFHTINHGQKGRTIEGTGIGLSLVKELVDLHKGKILVDSEVDKGTRIDIYIPLGSSHIGVDSKSTEKEPHDAHVDSQSIRSFMGDIVPLTGRKDTLFNSSSGSDEEKPLVLVVDDNQDVRNFIGRCLTKKFQPIYAENGKEALEILQKRTLPDLIVTDIMMPEMDGYQLVEEIQKFEDWRNIPIILVSARAGEESKLEGFSYGVVDYIAKPFSAKDLLTRVTAQIQLAQERKRTLQIERDLRTASESANDAKDRFLAALSHELRTPLNPVLLLAESLQSDSELPEKFKHDIHSIERNIRLEVQLIDDLLDMTRISKGKIVLTKSITSCHELLQQTIKILQSDIGRKQQNIALHFEAQSYFMNVDPTRIQQVFWNIIKNAVKFTSKMGSITITTKNNSSNDICVSISDTGIGIKKEDLPRVFDSFEQLNKKITQQFGGLGLGLFISRMLTELHHGTIAVESDGLSKGTTFIVTLPTVEPPQGDDLLKLSSVSQMKEEQIPPLRILLVEDSKPTQLVMRKLLSKIGHRVIVASNCRQAILLLDRLYKFESGFLSPSLSHLCRSSTDCINQIEKEHLDSIDLLLCDIGLPDGTGWDLMLKIKNLFRGNVPFKSIH